MKTHCRDGENSMISSTTGEKVQREKSSSDRDVFELRAISGPVLHLAVEESRAVIPLSAITPQPRRRVDRITHRSSIHFSLPFLTSPFIFNPSTSSVNSA